VFQAGVKGLFRRSGDVLSARNGSGSAEKWTSVKPLPSMPKTTPAAPAAETAAAAMARTAAAGTAAAGDPMI